MIRWEPCVLLLAAVIGVCMAGACRRDDPPPQAPSTAPSAAPVRVTGTEKIVWDQAANNATQLARYRYIVYIDDVPVDPVAAACSTTTSINRTFTLQRGTSEAVARVPPAAVCRREETDGDRGAAEIRRAPPRRAAAEHIAVTAEFLTAQSDVRSSVGYTGQPRPCEPGLCIIGSAYGCSASSSRCLRRLAAAETIRRCPPRRRRGRHLHRLRRLPGPPSR